jgi:protein-tyrosine phosphatase
MSKVFDNIYVGSLEDAYNYDIICNVTHILNVADELILLDRVDHKYLKFGVNDDDEYEDITRIFDSCINWIHEAINVDGGSVLIHCLEGKSRSVCVSIAYLCTKCNFNFEDSLNHITSMRPCIDIFPLYLEQTIHYINKHKLSKRNCCSLASLCHFQ